MTNGFLRQNCTKKAKLTKRLILLKKKGWLYEKEGAIWFRATAFGDERDRVLIKSNKEKTYLAGDLAYHRYKFEKKKFDKVINVWGADHYGDVVGLKAGMEALGHKDKTDIVLLQFVTVIKEGKPVKMSKRLGTAIIMDDLLEELSPDVIRFFFWPKRRILILILIWIWPKSSRKKSCLLYSVCLYQNLRYFKESRPI